MDYRILLTGVFLVLLGLGLAYRDFADDLNNEVIGTLIHKEKRIEVITGPRAVSTQYNTYLYLEGFEAPFIYREFDKSKMEERWPSFNIGDNLTLYINKHTGLVWGMSRNGIQVLNPKYRAERELSGALGVSIFGGMLVFIGVCRQRIKEFFGAAKNYS